MQHPTVRLSQARPEDAEAIRRLTRDAYAKWVPLIGREPRPMAVDYDAAVARDRFELAYVDDVLAGLIQIVFEEDAILIENVAVAPPFQHQGIGRRLLQQAEGLARNTARQRVRLYTNKRFQENISLYQSLGYHIDREELMGDAIAVHMSKSMG